jgi:hypothetical protein
MLAPPLISTELGLIDSTWGGGARYKTVKSTTMRSKTDGGNFSSVHLTVNFRSPAGTPMGNKNEI